MFIAIFAIFFSAMTVGNNSQILPDIAECKVSAGSLFVVNNCYGAPTIGIGTDATVSLMDSRIGESANVATGTTIGLARVYDFNLSSGFLFNSL